jgi:DNA (cytosine-5)-methyltransferase 1
MKDFTFIDLFAGIGGFRIALEVSGGKCVGFSEIDKTAIETYKKNFDTTGEIEFGDISKVTSVPRVDVVVGGVPCQSWSVAGKRKGFDDPRGKLWFDAINFVKKSEPKVLFLRISKVWQTRGTQKT